MNSFIFFSVVYLLKLKYNILPLFWNVQCFIILDTFTQKVHNYFIIPYYLMSRKHVILLFN